MENHEPPRADTLAQALEEYEHGRRDQALALCTSALEQDPGNPHALCLMAKLSLDRGEPCKAEEQARRAIAILDGQADFYDTLGRALNNQKRLADAAGAFERALACDSGHTTAYNNLGHIRRQQGDLRAALELFKEATALDPGHAGAWHNLGITHMLLGHPVKAVRALERCIEIEDANPTALFNLGNALSDMGSTHRAVEVFERVLALKPSDVDALSNLGAALQREGKIEAAKRSFQRVLSIAPGHSPALAALAGIFDLEGSPHEGLALLEGPVNEPDPSAVVLVAYAQLCRRSKRPLAPVAAMLERLDARKLALHEQHTLHFTLGDIYDELGDYDTAFRHYTKANDKRKGGFDPDAYEQFVDRLLAAFSQRKLDKLARSGITAELPVFIVGMPRSGTTLVEQILASHPQVHGAGELSAIGQIGASLTRQSDIDYPDGLERIGSDALTAAARRHIDHLRALAPDASRITDKMWQNFEHLGLIELLFPGARIIHCVRDPLDTGLSCYFQSFGAGGAPFSFDLSHIGFFYSQYLRLMGHWRHVLKLPMIDIRYEELVEEPEAVSRRLVDFTGVEWDPACLRFYESDRVVTTASHAQVKRPIYTTSVNRHRHYLRHLAPLIEALEAPQGRQP